MIGPNLSEWAITHRSLVVFFMIAARGRGGVVFLAARSRRGPGHYGPHDGRYRGLARRDRR